MVAASSTQVVVRGVMLVVVTCRWRWEGDSGGCVNDRVIVIQVVVIASSMGVAVVAMLVVVALLREVARQW